MKTPVKDENINHNSKITLYNDDCLIAMKNIPDKSVDLVLCDLPYGTTACTWDEIIPFDKLWEQYERILKPKGNILLFGDNSLFTASLMLSKKNWFKYNWVWRKNRPTGFLNAKKQPLRAIEAISVFGRPGQNFYKPQMVKGKVHNTEIHSATKFSIYSKQQDRSCPSKSTDEYYPTNIIEGKEYSISNQGRLHSAEKPVALLKYLIKTYTNEGMTVLDNTMGSGSTGVASKELGRDFIGIELNKEYFDIAKQRINGDKK